MTELVKYNSGSINKLTSNLDFYKYNPTAMQQTIFNYLEEITNGEVDIVDPTNPFVFLLEASTVNTSLAITESLNNLRMQYPSLAQTEEDIYLHMSDVDFINRFSSPSTTNFTMAIRVDDLYNKMIYDTVNECHKVIIPRNTEFIIDDLTFTLLYPIVIKKFINGVVQIMYDNEITTPLEALTTNILDYEVRKNNDNTSWIFFTIKASQFKINTSYYTTQKSIPFSNNIAFTDKFYYARVYYRNNNTNSWKEILTTYTDQVFNIDEPTAIIKLYTNSINVFIPPIYITNNQISGEIRVDIYNTKGELTINLANYKIDSFTVKFSNVEQELNINEYTNAFNNLTYYLYNENIVTGGTNGLSFSELKKRVIDNSIGERKIPITNVQLSAYVNDYGFDILTNVDILTNRIFLATKKLPIPLENKLITSANIGMISVLMDLNNIKEHYNVKNNGNRLTLLSNTLFINKNGIVSIIGQTELNEIISKNKINLAHDVNNNYYIYNPYYYILDSTDNEFEVRVYHLDAPTASNLNFISQNQSIQLPVNTISYDIIKTLEGYKITIITKSGNFYKQLPDSLVNAQIGYYSKGENSLAYINGILIGKTEEDERIYEFDIITNHDLDADNYMCITNGKMFNNEDLDTYINLNSNFSIFYTTSSLTTSFVPDEADSLIGKFMLPENSVAVTHEKLNINLGYTLKNLWVRSRSLASGLEYKLHEQDVPMLYTKDVYEVDPVTNSIFSIVNGEVIYNKIHDLGDPVLDELGNQIYKYRKGDVVVDNEGNPVIDSELSSNKEIDLLMVDGKYYFVTDQLYKDYKVEFSNIISSWITDNISNIEDELLEQSKLYFYPKTNIGLIEVYIDNITRDYISAEQSFKIDLYVNNNVFRDNDIRNQLISGSIKILDTYIGNEIVNMSDIFSNLKTFYSDSVISFNIAGLGGDKDYKIVKIITENNRLCLKKKLSLQSNDLFIIEEDIIVEFHNIEKL